MLLRTCTCFVEGKRAQNYAVQDTRKTQATTWRHSPNVPVSLAETKCGILFLKREVCERKRDSFRNNYYCVNRQQSTRKSTSNMMTRHALRAPKKLVNVLYYIYRCLCNLRRRATLVQSLDCGAGGRLSMWHAPLSHHTRACALVSPRFLSNLSCFPTSGYVITPKSCSGRGVT